MWDFKGLLSGASNPQCNASRKTSCRYIVLRPKMCWCFKTLKFKDCLNLHLYHTCLHQDKGVAFFTLPALLQFHNILVGTEPLSCEFLGEEFDAKKPLG